jgi:hypothetical protein
VFATNIKFVSTSAFSAQLFFDPKSARVDCLQTELPSELAARQSFWPKDPVLIDIDVFSPWPSRSLKIFG